MCKIIKLFRKTDKSVYDFISKLEARGKEEHLRRKVGMIIRGIVGLAFVGLGIYFAWWEFGSAIFQSVLFWALLCLWAYFSFAMFLDRLSEMDKKTASEKMDDLDKKIDTKFDTLIEKIDELIEEIRQERNERNNKNKQ